MKIGADVINVLDNCLTDGSRLFLPSQLDRKDYLAVDKALQAAGGKWNRSAKAHVFPGDAAAAIESMILTGSVTTDADMGFFETPPAVVARLIELAELKPDHVVLEPSAGLGAIAAAVVPLASAVVLCEIDPGRAAALHRSGFHCVHEGDFLGLDASVTKYDRVVMNPPFAKQADITHVLHALPFLKAGGLLVSVMSEGVTFRQNRKAAKFREMVTRRGGSFEPLPAGSFKASGTGVGTVIAVIPGGGCDA